MEDGLEIQTWLPVNVHPSGNHLQYCIPINWNLFDIQSSRFYSGKKPNEKRKRIRDKIWKLIFNEEVYGGDIETIFNELIDDWRKIGDLELKFCKVCGVTNSFSATQCECGVSF